ncbi:transposase [Salinimicrobium xinjiangense]|uniref:transposase n=1 Tax=Salinimicrobium xinjiangense TaxID=438596 RepID=UPI0006876F03|nr:transposase [Salinimicrobium xinjiangense]
MRKPGWDYSSNAAYFVTLCTKDRKNYFGKVGKGKMEKSEIGNLVHNFWEEIPGHFPFVELGEFVVMPNHFHGIIVINNNSRKPVETPNLGVSTVVDKKRKIGNRGQLKEFYSSAIPQLE